MAYGVNEIRQQENVTPAAQQPMIAAGSHPTSQTTIDFKSKANDVQNPEQVNFFSSEEYKNAPDPFVLFKSKFCPGMSEDEAKQIYTNAKQAASQQNEGTCSDTKAEPVGEKSVLDKALDAYAKKHNLETVTIDDLKADDSPEAKALYKRVTDQPLMSKEEKIFRVDMSLEDQMYEVAERYINLLKAEGRDVDGFQPIDAVRFLSDKMEPETKSKSKYKLSNDDKIKLCAAFEVLAQNDMTIREFNKLEKSVRKSMIDEKLNEEKQLMIELFNDVSSISEKNFNGKDLLKSLDFVLKEKAKEIDSGFVNLSEEQQNAKIENFRDSLMGKYIPGWPNLKNDKAKGHALFTMLDNIKCAKFSGIPYEQLLREKEKFSARKLEYHKSEYKNTDKVNILLVDDVLAQLDAESELNNEVPTFENKLKRLDEMIKSNPKNKLFHIAKRQLEMDNILGIGSTTDIDTGRYLKCPETERQAIIERDIQNDLLSGIENKSPEEIMETLKSILNGAGRDIETINLAKELLLNNCKGVISEDVIEQAYQESQAMEKANSSAVAREDREAAANSTTEISKWNNRGARMSVKFQQKFFDSQADRVFLGQEYTKSENIDLIDSYNEGGALFRPDTAVDTAYKIAHSGELNDAQRAMFTESAVRTAKDPQLQLRYGETFSKSDNAAVIEGLAAASGSVDESVRAQYNSNIENSMKNFTPEQQANIKSAMQTGEISKQTLSQTAPKVEAKAEQKSEVKTGTVQQGSADKTFTGAPQQAAQSVSAQLPGQQQQVPPTGASSVAQVVHTAPASPKVSSIDLPQEGVKSVSSSSVSSTSSTSNSPARVEEIERNNREVREMEVERQKVADNIVKTQEKIREEVSAHEEKRVTEELKAVANDILDENNADEVLKDDIEYKELKAQIKKASSIAEVYQIIAGLGGQAKSSFLARISTKDRALNAFVQKCSDKAVLMELYSLCSDGAKSKIISKLPEDMVLGLLERGEIPFEIFKKLSPEILQKFLMERINNMSVDDFKNYINLFPIEYQGEILNRFLLACPQEQRANLLKTFRAVNKSFSGIDMPVSPLSQNSATDSVENSATAKSQNEKKSADEQDKRADDADVPGSDKWIANNRKPKTAKELKETGKIAQKQKAHQEDVLATLQYGSMNTLNDKIFKSYDEEWAEQAKTGGEPAKIAFWKQKKRDKTVHPDMLS